MTEATSKLIGSSSQFNSVSLVIAFVLLMLSFAAFFASAITQTAYPFRFMPYMFVCLAMQLLVFFVPFEHANYKTIMSLQTYALIMAASYATVRLAQILFHSLLSICRRSSRRRAFGMIATLHFDKALLIGFTLLHPFLLFSANSRIIDSMYMNNILSVLGSSLVEEEHQIFYFFVTSSFIVLLRRSMLARSPQSFVRFRTSLLVNHIIFSCFHCFAWLCIA